MGFKSILFGGMLLLYPNTILSQNIHTNTGRRQSSSIDFTQPNDNLAFITVKINGKDAIFLLDTGSGSSIINTRQLQHYGLQTIPIYNFSVSGIGGAISTSRVSNLDVIEIDEKKYTVSFLATDLNDVRRNILNGSKINITGILGSDFFEYHKAVLDYSKNTIIFRDIAITKFHRHKIK